MELMELLETRRSVRAYQAGREVAKEDLAAMIYAAQQAPSWKNSQTARYYVAVSEQAKAAVKEALPGFNRNSTENACAYFVTTFVKKRAGFDKDGNPDNELGDEWGAYDLGLSNANLILKARELGLDTLIMGLRDCEKLRSYFGISDSEQVAAVLSVGYREKDPEKPARKNPEEIAAFF